MNLEDNKPAQKDKYCMTPLMEVFKVAKFIETEYKIEKAAGGREIEAVSTQWVEFQVCKMKKSRRPSARQCEYT